jgi:PAS domain S-box-containing protein
MDRSAALHTPGSLPSGLETPPAIRRITSLQRWSRLAGAAICLSGLLVLIGWHLDIETLKRVAPGMAAMNPLSAVSFLLCGVSLLLVRGHRIPSPVQQAIAATLMAIGTIKLLAIVGLWDAGIDGFLYASKLINPQTGKMNGMAPNSAANFLLTGLALLIVDGRNARARWLSQFLAVAIGIVSLFSVVGYAYGITTFYDVPAFIPMAIHTAMTFLLVSIALLWVHPDEGLMRLIVNDTTGGMMARRLLVPGVLVPGILGWLRLLGQQAGLYGSETGTALFTIATIVIFTLLTYWNARVLFRLDTERHVAEEGLQRAHAELEQRVRERTAELAETNSELQAQIAERNQTEAMLRQTEQRFHMLAESMPQMVWTSRPDGRVDYRNQRWFEYTGMSREWFQELDREGNGATGLVYPDDIEGYKAKWESALRAGVLYEAEFRMRRGSDGSFRWHLVRALPVRDLNGEIVLWVGSFTDIDDQKRAVETLRQSRDELEVRVRERTAAFEQAKEAAEAASRTKGEFLANMSHEIRTPMNGVIGAMDLLFGSELTPAQLDLANIARGSAHALLTIINDILDFSKLEAGKLALENIPFDLLMITEQVAGMIAANLGTLGAEPKHIDLIVHYAPQTPRYLIGDPGRIRQVITNLMSNAVKFTHSGHVLLDIETVEQSEHDVLVRIAVEDTGIGIPDEKIGSVFDMFTQADASTTRRYGGTGLGLAISRQLVELMDGEITVSSRLNEGSTFAFTARLKLAPVPAMPPEQRTAIRDARILIVDDNEINRRVLLERMTGWKLHATACGSAGEALQTLIRESESGLPFHIAVLDFQMPDMDGEMLARAIKEVPRIAGTSLIMLSSMGYRANTTRDDAGFEAYLVKPARESEMYDTLATILSSRGGGERHSRPNTRRELSGDGPSWNATIHGRRARVLLVEDNAVNQKIAALMLTNLGCHVDVAVNGRDGLERLLAAPYDIIFMDCEMPVMDGFAATEAIRENMTIDPALPVVALTAKAVEGDRERCLQSGMNDYMSKPVQMKNFQMMLERWLPIGSGGQTGKAADTGLRAEPAPVADAAPLDPEVIATLRGLAEATDPELLRQILQTFVADTAERLPALRGHAAAGDGPGLSKVAHTIKGASANIGANRMAELSQRLQKIGASGSLDDVESGIDELEREFERVRTAIEDLSENACAS